MKRHAFTLIELLVVIAIIMLLAGLLMPAFSAARNTARKTKAKAEVKQLEIAWKGVLMDYRTWATASAGAGAGAALPTTDGTPQKMGATACLFLQGSNNKRTTYMEFDRGSTNSLGDFIDPWYQSTDSPADKHAYQVCLGAAQVVPGPTLNRAVVAWSKGKDVVDVSDDVKSWE